MIVEPLPADWSLCLQATRESADIPELVRNAGDIPATVPGCVHTDLLAQGLIPDPYLGRNEPLTHWIGHADWSYHTDLILDSAWFEHDRLEVVFEGLDTVATVSLNDRVIGTSANMHVRRCFGLNQSAKIGLNKLRVDFASPIAEARRMDAELGPRPSIGQGTNANMPHHAIRKMACNFGWDWGPQLVTSGIWRPAFLRAWSVARLGDVRPVVLRADPDVAELSIGSDVERVQASPCRLHHVLRDPDGREIATNELDVENDSPRCSLRIKQPRRWWPIGYGDQPLYMLETTLLDRYDQVLDRRCCRVGLRTVELCTHADAGPVTEPIEGLGQGETFHIKVNGQRVFCKGANWIPDDCFPHRVTPERYRRRIDQAIDANMNMLRVWGGGLYEDRAFYEHCDRRGVLVWQDFLMACACYPEEQPLATHIEEEARDNVSRLSHHPSLVLWNGCNENIWGTYEWGEAWIDIRERGEVTWGLGYYLDVFPRVVAELDPSRPYWPGSPYSGTMDKHPNLNTHGNRHIWDVWNGPGNYRNYLGHHPRFASEFGYQGPCAWPTLQRAISQADQQWLSPTMLAHNKQPSGQQIALDRIGDDFAYVPDGEAEFADTWFLASLQQCRALTLGCEWFRALSPWCSGALYWQLNDCWPVTSWSAIDGDGRAKLLWHATARFFRDRLVTVMPAHLTPAGSSPERMAVYLHNDHRDTWDGHATVQKMRLNGETLDTLDFRFTIAPRGSHRTRLAPTWTGSQDEFLVAQIRSEAGAVLDQAFWFFGTQRTTAYALPALSVELSREGHTQVAIVSTDHVVRDLCLLADLLDSAAEVDGQFVTLLPGQSTRFVIRGARPLSVAECSDPSVLRCANQLTIDSLQGRK